MANKRAPVKAADRSCRQGANWEGEANQVAVAYCDTHKRPYLECKLEGSRREAADPWDLVIKLNDDHFPGWRDGDLYYQAADLNTEAGEVLNDAKHLVGRGTNVRSDVDYRLKTKEEMVDLWHYFVLFWTSLGYSREDFVKALREKVAVNRGRMEARARGEDPP